MLSEAKHLESLAAKEILRFAQDDRAGCSRKGGIQGFGWLGREQDGTARFCRHGSGVQWCLSANSRLVKPPLPGETKSGRAPCGAWSGERAPPEGQSGEGQPDRGSANGVTGPWSARLPGANLFLAIGHPSHALENALLHFFSPSPTQIPQEPKDHARPDVRIGAFLTQVSRP